MYKWLQNMYFPLNSTASKLLLVLYNTMMIRFDILSLVSQKNWIKEMCMYKLKSILIH